MFNEVWKERRKIPKHIRLFLVSKDQFLYIYDGKVGSHMSAEGVMSHIRKERGEILDSFTQFEFLINEFLRFEIIGIETNERVIDVVRRYPVGQKISFLEDWKLITSSLAKSIRKIFQVRDGMAHKFQTNETQYLNKPIFENFEQFLKDMQSIWDDLVHAYNTKLNEFDFSKILQEIRES